MELKRGKTFIKSSLHGSHDKPPDSAIVGPNLEDRKPWSTSPGAQQCSPGERCQKLGPSNQVHDRGSHKGTPSEPEGAAPFRSVRKSKTQESVPGTCRTAPVEGQLVGSASFPGPSGGQRMIDYRHFVPQMPFVPAVAKSIPKKRISLKRPKKCFRNLFHLRRSKTENLAALAAEGRAPSPLGVTEAGGSLDGAFLPWGEGLGLDGQGQELSDSELLPEPPFSLCRALCEDVASLKSFDSLTGCGEIFADESSAPTLELPEEPRSPSRAPSGPEGKVPGDPCQGSAEQLASPAQNDLSDLTRFWDGVNRSVRQQQRALVGPWLDAPPEPDARTEPQSRDAEGLAGLPLFPCRPPNGGSKASSVDTGTPKSEQPESLSTSDEGYYDSFSPGLDEDKKEAGSLGPAATAALPRDSYSGDALYELFCDPGQGPAAASPDDDLCVSESLSGPGRGPPLSMCSFHVGAEENLAPAPGPDLLGQSFLQSSWRGKECLLKLCDTELAITMGIINWLRRGPELRAPPGQRPAEPREPGCGRVALQRAGPAEQEGRGFWTPEVGGATVGSAAPGPEPWVLSGTQELRAGDAVALLGAQLGPGSLHRDPSLQCTQVSRDPGMRGHAKNSFSLESPEVSETRGTCSKGKVPATHVWPGPLGCFQNPWRSGPGVLEAEPSLPAQLAALQIHSPAVPSPEQLCGQPRTRGPELLRQKPSTGFPRVSAICGLPSVAGQQDQRCPGHLLNLSRFRVDPDRLDAPGEDLPVWLSPRAREQMAHVAQLDS